MQNVLTEFIGYLVDGVEEMGRGIGSGLNQAVTSMFLKTNETTGAIEGLSTFGGVIRCVWWRSTSVLVLPL